MTIRDLGKSIFINFADDSYRIANWKSREIVISILREGAKEIKRLIDLGTLAQTLSEFAVDKLNGAIMSLEFAAETFCQFDLPILEVRKLLQQRRDELKVKCLGFRRREGAKRDIRYIGTSIKVLDRVLQSTLSLENEDNKLRVESKENVMEEGLV